MALVDIVFWFFSLVLLAGAVLAIASRSPVNSAIFLIQSFLGMAGLFLLLHAFFLAVVQVLVYAGAVVVLFLFVIMLLDLQPSALRRLRSASTVLGGLLGLALALELFFILRMPDALPRPAMEPAEGGLGAVVLPLFRDYLLPIQFTALILLAAMIGVVVLARREPS